MLLVPIAEAPVARSLPGPFARGYTEGGAAGGGSDGNETSGAIRVFDLVLRRVVGL